MRILKKFADQVLIKENMRLQKTIGWCFSTLLNMQDHVKLYYFSELIDSKQINSVELFDKVIKKLRDNLR